MNTFLPTVSHPQPPQQPDQDQEQDLSSKATTTTSSSSKPKSANSTPSSSPSASASSSSSIASSTTSFSPESSSTSTGTGLTGSSMLVEPPKDGLESPAARGDRSPVVTTAPPHHSNNHNSLRKDHPSTSSSASTSTSVDLTSLTVEDHSPALVGEEEEDGEDAASQQKRKTAKTRRASTLSSGSSAMSPTTERGNIFASSSSTGRSGAGAGVGTGEMGQQSMAVDGGGEDKEGLVPRPGRRKAARVGSFRRDEDQAPLSSSHFDPSSVEPAEREPSQPATPPQHVDIVSYPPADLLRLLASLLEQIAHANDELNARAAQVQAHQQQQQQQQVGRKEDLDRFDAAPLNSPVTPRSRRNGASTGTVDEGDEDAEDYSGDDGSGDDDREAAAEAEAMDTDQPPAQPEQELPNTPGIDLLNEVDADRPGVAGFMPSLGGAHTPVPLSRRRGSSFLNHGHGGAGRDRPPTGSATSSSSNIHHSSSSTTTTSSSNSNSNNSSASHTPQPPAPTSASEPPITSLLTASSLALSSPSATLCFHARNVPAISIEAYLLRILKYCPTTNEVFLSLLVYFDRMARVGLEAQRVGLTGSGASGSPTMSSGNGTTTTTSNRLFAIDSFNVHRLVIAGVTVASKFFSDVFYTNSRYAKVGGLPLHELNQLELQFLLLNDFRLMIPVDELQRYADQLILFWVGRNPGGGGAGTPGVGDPHPQQQQQPQLSQPQPQPPHHQQAPPHQQQAPAPLTASAVASVPTSSTSSIPFPASSSSTHPNSYANNAPGTPMAHIINSSTLAHNRNRPRSIRSQPSSSGTSVTSTITPGTPSTTRASDDGHEEDDEDGEGVEGHYEDREGEEGAGVEIFMDQD